MARPSEQLIRAIRNTVKKIKSGQPYQWGHMGACNCGNLAQELTHLSKGEIHEFAMRGRGDWTEQVEAFCPTSEMPMDLLINQLIGAGLSLEDLIHLERLSDKAILSRIPLDKRMKLRHNCKEDVATYMESWAAMLEERLQKKMSHKMQQQVVSLA